MSRTAGLAIALLAALLAGCEKVQLHEQETKLDETVQLYVRAIRWGELEAAAALIRWRKGEPPPVDLAALKGLRVTDFQYNLEGHTPGQPEAAMTVRFDYYFESSGRVRRVTSHGVWWYDAALSRWFLEGTFPDFVR